MKSKLSQKHRARKSCKKNIHEYDHQSIYNLVLQLLIALTCSLISSSSFSLSFHWLSYQKLKQFLLNPSAVSSLLSPMCLFLAMNVIIIILIAESRLTNSSSPTDIYDEYVKRSQCLQRRRAESSINSDLHVKIDVKIAKEEKGDLRVDEKEEVNEGVEVVGIENTDHNGVEEDGGDMELRIEELNRKVENFIARVHKRMWVEAHSENVQNEITMADLMEGSFNKNIVVR